MIINFLVFFYKANAVDVAGSVSDCPDIPGDEKLIFFFFISSP